MQGERVECSRIQVDQTLHLDKLVLQITQACNLTCAFCITQQGEWGNPNITKFMPPSLAVLAVEKFASIFSSISAINFFGGEPTLNLEAIREVGAKIRTLTDMEIVASPVHLSMATNGMCASDEFIALIRAYDMRFVVSVDGPTDVNDSVRVDRAGNGTYERIRNNVQRLREHTGFPKGIAFTYSARHLRSDMTMWEMLCKMREDFGIRDFAIMPATNSPHTPGQWDPLIENPDRFIEEYSDCIRRSLIEHAERDEPIMIQYGRRALSSMVEEPSYWTCPAATSYFAVSAIGDVFPCQNLPENSTYRITSVCSNSFADDLRNCNMRSQIWEANANAIRQIGKSADRGMCRICPSDNLGETGELETCSLLRWRLYKAINETTRQTFLDIVANSDETKNELFLSKLGR